MANAAKKPADNPNAARTGLDFAAEDRFWRENHGKSSYATKEDVYDDYAPAYRTGYEGRGRFTGKRFEDVETDLKTSYESIKGKSKLGWEKAKSAARAAWDRVERALPGDSDNDGK